MSLNKKLQESNEDSQEGELKIIKHEAFNLGVFASQWERANIDMQVETANKYPRDEDLVIARILKDATTDEDTARACFYALPMKDKNGNVKIIEGVSIRFVELILGRWKNLATKAIILGHDNKYVTTEAIAWDLETNTRVSQQVKRRITREDGSMMSDSGIVTTSNAACSIAMRNVVLKVVPSILLKKIQDQIKNFYLGKESAFKKSRDNAIKYFKDNGVELNNILLLLNKEKIEDLNRDDVFKLNGITIAVQYGDTSLAELFGNFAKKKYTASNKIMDKLNKMDNHNQKPPTPYQEPLTHIDDNSDKIKESDLKESDLSPKSKSSESNDVFPKRPRGKKTGKK